MRARFGNRGRIAVEFRQTGGANRHRPPPGCSGKALVVRRGVFVGTIAFRGEQGYTRVAATRARGVVQGTPRWRCGHEPGGGGQVPESGSDEELTILEARSKDRKLVFGAVSMRPPEERGSTIFVASSQEDRGAMEVFGLVLVPARERTFAFDDSLASAVVRPPKPFAGTATYTRGSGRSFAWTGPMSVTLPGSGEALLTGSRFRTRLFQPETLTEVSGRTGPREGFAAAAPHARGTAAFIGPGGSPGGFRFPLAGMEYAPLAVESRWLGALNLNYERNAPFRP